MSSAEAKQRYASGEVELAETELPFEPGEATGVPFAYVPSTATGIAFMYNLTIDGERVTSLWLSRKVAAFIYTCGITHWDNPAIAGRQPFRISRSNPSLAAT